MAAVKVQWAVTIMSVDPYQTLKVNRDATAEEIRAAYFRLARRHHPDHNLGDPAAADRFKRVQMAYESLTSRPPDDDWLPALPVRAAPLPSWRRPLAAAVVVTGVLAVLIANLVEPETRGLQPPNSQHASAPPVANRPESGITPDGPGNEVAHLAEGRGAYAPSLESTPAADSSAAPKLSIEQTPSLLVADARVREASWTEPVVPADVPDASTTDIAPDWLADIGSPVAEVPAAWTDVEPLLAIPTFDVPTLGNGANASTYRLSSASRPWSREPMPTRRTPWSFEVPPVNDRVQQLARESAVPALHTPYGASAPLSVVPFTPLYRYPTGLPELARLFRKLEGTRAGFHHTPGGFAPSWLPPRSTTARWAPDRWPSPDEPAHLPDRDLLSPAPRAFPTP